MSVLDKKWFVYECGKVVGLKVYIFKIVARNLAHATKIATNNGMYVIECLGEKCKK